jgi:hypothetical protein
LLENWWRNERKGGSCQKSGAYFASSFLASVLPASSSSGMFSANCSAISTPKMMALSCANLVTKSKINNAKQKLNRQANAWRFAVKPKGVSSHFERKLSAQHGKAIH